MRPIYDGIRRFLGLKDLVVSFYTQRCQFNCTFCSLHRNSSPAPVSTEDINRQIDRVFDKYRREIRSIQQFSFGNEGSVLDNKRFYKSCMDYLLRRCEEMTGLEVVSLETRPEYITEGYLRDILKKAGRRKLDVTIGFETQDDVLRTEVLSKRLSKETVEEKIRLLGSLGVRLTSYVMIKPGPSMTESEGVREALLTIEYLSGQCSKSGTELVIYLNPTYIPETSDFERIGRKSGYAPPGIQSVFRVIMEARRWGVPVYTGLWSENINSRKRDYRGREGYDPDIERAIKDFNRTNDFSRILEQGSAVCSPEPRLSF